MGPAQWIFLVARSKAVPVSKLSNQQLDKEYEITRGKWHLWRNRFKEVAADKKFGKECRTVAANAVDIMDVLERAKTF
jgi:hypothetical protein